MNEFRNRSDLARRYLLFCGDVTNSPKMSVATMFNEVRSRKLYMGLLCQ